MVTKRVNQNIGVKTAKPKSKTKATTLEMHNFNPFISYTHAVHTGESIKAGPNQVALWIPYLCKAKINFFILVRNKEMFNWLKENYPYLHVVFCKRIDDIEQVVEKISSLKYILYPSNTANLIHTLRYTQFEHIFIGHGDSDKTSSAHKFFRVYDQIWVAGQAHIDRFANAGFTISTDFVKVGRPSLKAVIEQTKTNWQERKPSVLYLPTWEGVFEETNYSSVKHATKILSFIAEKFKLPVNAKFHPMTGNRDKLLLNIEEQISQSLDEKGVEHKVVNKLQPLNEVLVESNIFLCDISGVVSDCIAANGPIFVYVPKDKKIQISKSNMSYDYYAYTWSTLEELYSELERVLGGDDYKQEQRKQAKEYLIGSTETEKDTFIKLLQQKA
ncbi:CDP-glycerol glycerophosphotransferase family protein [Psittacicella gerlachiana]|nr:CDP-glycerol glycerophosphotransferase family protein [Psittacicella gerlachiana]